MKKFTRKYRFDNLESMIDLAQLVQVNVSMSLSFYEGEEGEEDIPWRAFWDVITDEIRKGCIGVDVVGDTVYYVYSK